MNTGRVGASDGRITVWMGVDVVGASGEVQASDPDKPAISTTSGLFIGSPLRNPDDVRPVYWLVRLKSRGISNFLLSVGLCGPIGLHGSSDALGWRHLGGRGWSADPAALGPDSTEIGSDF